MQAMQHRQADNFAVNADKVGCYRCDGNGLTNALVGSSQIEVADVFLNLMEKVPLGQDEQVIQALPPQAAHESFADRIGAWCPDGRMQYLNAYPCSYPIKLCAEFAVVVADEKTRSLSEGRRLAQLLRYPHLPWMMRDADLDNSA